MRIRGERTCVECGATWSYFETGSVACPECGSVQSTGSGTRTQNTDRPVNLDLQEARALAADGDLESALRSASQDCLTYVRQRGFVDAGSLRELDDAYVHAQELRHTAVLARSFLEIEPAERSHLLGLLDGPADDRPAPSAVPERLSPGRALGIASAVRDYRDDVRSLLDEQEEGRGSADCQTLLGTIDEHRKRVHALDGDVAPTTTEDLLEAARAVGRYCREGDEESFEVAKKAVEQLG